MLDSVLFMAKADLQTCQMLRFPQPRLILGITGSVIGSLEDEECEPVWPSGMALGW